MMMSRSGWSLYIHSMHILNRCSSYLCTCDQERKKKKENQKLDREYVLLGLLGRSHIEEADDRCVYSSVTSSLKRPTPDSRRAVPPYSPLLLLDGWGESRPRIFYRISNFPLHITQTQYWKNNTNAIKINFLKKERLMPLIFSLSL